MKYDAVVIGSGAGGFYFSINSAKKGKKIALIEMSEFGGTAFTSGCLPVKKIMDKIKCFRKAENLEYEGLLTLNKDMNLLYEVGRKSTSNIEDFIKEKLNENNIDIYIGEAEILKGNKVKINETIIEGKDIIIATGSKACSLKNSDEVDEKIILSHKGILRLEKIPAEITILGGNVEGIEFASLFSELGVKVTVIEKEEEILRGNDSDLIENIKKRLVSNGVDFILGESVVNIEKVDDVAVIRFEDGKILKTQKLLVTGLRKASVPKGIKELGIKLKNGYIGVNENLMTSEERIYAIGDVNGIHGMAHIAIQQGILLSDFLYDKKKISFDYSSLPRCIFTINELAGAGCQENELENCEVKKIYFKNTFRGFDNTFDDGFIKVILKDNEVKGIWINSMDAGSLIGNIGLWIDKKIDIDDIKRSLFINPTLSESLLDAVMN